MSFEYPAAAPAFYVQSTSGKARLFIGEFGSRSRTLTPLTTVNVGSNLEVDRLVAALESAAWYGDRGPWDALARLLPEAVVLACNQALTTMPPPTSLAIGSDGWPMTVLSSRIRLSPGGEDLQRLAAAAYDTSAQVLIDNYLDDLGDGIFCRVRLLSGEAEIIEGSAESAWPRRGESAVERQVFGPDELSEVLNDPRWLTNHARAHWVWVADREEGQEDYTSEAVWVVEYFDEAVPDDPVPAEPEEWQRYVVGEWNPWPMTPRTRFVLWQSLIGVEVMLDTGLEGWAENEVRPEDDDFMEDFPELVRMQPRSWWLELHRACMRLVDAMRTGESWNPRTPAEEALIYIASRTDWIDYAQQIIDDHGVLRRQFRVLPQGAQSDTNDEEYGDEAGGAPDHDWEEVPAALAGDVDIALLWTSKMDGIENPDDQTNALMGMGDYRAQSWHHRFDRYINDGELPSALY
ncbi:Uncharacterised protein [Mycobacteroides abscessus subsp. abscessus]|nr:Uncharacterised protein [Mycobacteroides abscessus subsp. abscessus]SHY16412.1 Uncharacterised protein [Mycobacteroides abscessus subsp. abscessus]SIB55734.1 Uncharacterised protein [Mycobacteroides abscessus subsp. abscessus]SIB95312.1 Uncharacterised protein [Mycobacteroides abscessus subsp. abscessus]SIC80026.1 Uncharacterised protein [Mycobacteroides abscessus subsp. abscessus]